VQVACAQDKPYAMEMIALDGRLYTRFGRDSEGKWEQSEDDPDQPLSAFSPEKLLAMLRDASSETARIGEEDVRGTPAVRYRLKVDREQADLGGGPPATAEVDVWIDDEGLVRRIQLDEAEGFTLDFFDFGVDVDIQAPPADQIVRPVPGFDPTTPAPCTPGAERPLKIDQVRRTLRAHGFDVEVTDDGCAIGVAGILTNAPDGDRSFDELLRGPGYLTCFVLMKSNEQAGTVGTGTSAPSGTQPYFKSQRSNENLACTLFADQANGDEADKRLDRAYDELEDATP
jgi:hypothetical protein